jgi:DNA (cytosine-5)-methyltransferase 1
MDTLSTAEAVVSEVQRACELLKQTDLAKALGVDPKTVRRWKNGTTLPPLHLLPALKQIMAHGRERTGAKSSPDFTFCDLFAGIGGIRLGFQASGGECVYTSEWNDFSQQTYRTNFGLDHEIGGDIVEVEAETLPDHDVLLAGFPCQPFSIAGVSKKNALGRPHGFECTTQGTLFYDVARIIAAKRPKAFLLENVKNLRSHDKGNTFRTIMEVLQNDLGYAVQWRIIDGKRFTPQHRERILIVGFREDVGFDFDALKLPEISDGPKLGSILQKPGDAAIAHDGMRFVDESGKVQAKYTLTPKLWQYLQDYAEKHRLKGNGFGFGLVGAEDVTRTLSARYYKDGSEILVKRGNRNVRPRRLTPRECARLMGFPDSFEIPVSDTQAYRQFGNSVVVPVMRAVAAHMKPHILAVASEEASQRIQPRLFTNQRDEARLPVAIL